MSEKEQEKEIQLTYVRLKDSATAFSDRTQQLTITGRKPLIVKNTIQIQKGIRGGALLKMTKEEYEVDLKLYNEKYGVKPVKKAIIAEADSNKEEKTEKSEKQAVIDELKETGIEGVIDIPNAKLRKMLNTLGIETEDRKQETLVKAITEYMASISE